MALPNLVDFPELRGITISKATFAPSKPCTIHFECLESGPNDSTRVRRFKGILRRARVKIFIVAYMGAFGSHFPEFRAIWLSTTKPKLQNHEPICSPRSKYSNFYFKPLEATYICMTTWGRRESIPHIPSRQTPASLIIQVRTLPHLPERTCKEKRTRSTLQFSQSLCGDSFTIILFVSRTNTRVLLTWGDLCYHCGPSPAWSIQTFLKNKNVVFANIWGYLRVYILSAGTRSTRYYVLNLVPTYRY
jgi:hypothetical protein